MFSYLAYALQFESEIELPELIEADVRLVTDPKARVRVVLGSVPTSIENGTLIAERESEVGRSSLWAAPNEVLLSMAGVGHYLVRDGNLIMVQPDEAAAPSDVRVFLLGTCFGALLQQRGFLVLHASGVLGPNGVMLFAGRSGSGKSTLLAEMMSRDLPMVVDDVCALDLDASGQVVVRPSFPRTRLWSDAAEALDVDTSGLVRTREHMDKFERHIPERYSGVTSRLAGIYVLRPTEVESVELIRVEPFEAIAGLKFHTYRREIVDGLGMSARQFTVVSRVASTKRVMLALRPKDRFAVGELADAILTDHAREARGLRG